MSMVWECGGVAAEVVSPAATLWGGLIAADGRDGRFCLSS